MIRILATLLLTVTLAHAGYVTGPLLDPQTGTGVTAQISFRLVTPTVVNATNTFYTKAFTLTATNGSFSNYLAGGKWTVQIGPRSDVLQFDMPNDTNVYSLGQLLNGGVTFMTSPSPVFVSRNANGTDFSSPSTTLTNLGGVSTNSVPINVLTFGAVGNGVTDDTTAFTNALAYSGTSGRPVFVPMGNYKVKPFTMYSKQALVGEVGSRLLFINVTAEALTMDYQSTNMTLANLELIRVGATQSIPSSDDGTKGLLIYNCQQQSWTVQNLYVEGFGTGIQVYGVGANVDGLARIKDCEIRYCYLGLEVMGQAEYLTFTGIKCVQNGYGLKESGGNNTFSSCNFSRNGIGAWFDSGANQAHGIMSACTFNHNNYAVVGTNISLGEIFQGCAFLPPEMYFTNVQGFQFISPLMGWDTGGHAITFDHSTNCAVLFPQDPYGRTNITYTAVPIGSSNIVYQPSTFSSDINGNATFAASLSVSGGIITNGALIWLTTNATPTTALPNGSIASVTDGRFFIRSNNNWVLH